MISAAERYQFETGVYRPPSEGGSASLLVRFTRNCPWNQCTFCGMYKEEEFSLRSVAEIKLDIDAMKLLWDDLKALSWQMGQAGDVTRESLMALVAQVPGLYHQPGLATLYHWIMAGAKTAFIQDANSLIMKTDDLVDALTYLRRQFPSIQRVTSYARAKTLVKKSDQELEAIRQAGLDRLHLGLESGDDVLLKKIKKGVTSEELIQGGQKAIRAGFEVSEYWMPGLGGKTLWESHAKNTARVLNEIQPHYIRSRPFHDWPGTPLSVELARGDMVLLSPREQLTELKTMIEGLDIDAKVCFDHTANYWRDRRGGLLFSHSHEGYQFPQDKGHVLALIEEGLAADNVHPAMMNF